MAKPAEDLSKSTEALSVGHLACTYLFHSGFVNPPGTRIRPHFHDCWHVDVILEGRLEVLFGHTALPLPAGSLVVVPAGVWHEFRGEKEGHRGWSVKFKVEGCPRSETGWVSPVGGVVRPLTDLLRDLLPDRRMVDGADRATVDHLLAALVSAECLPRLTPRPGVRDQLVRLARERGGRPLTVREAAERLGFSSSRLAARLREEGAPSAKTLIDHVRADIARGRLIYTEENVGEVAESLEFPDIYSFSRFYKRMTGKPPTGIQRGGEKRSVTERRGV